MAEPGPNVEVIPVRRRTPWDPLLVGLVIGALALAVVKPWAPPVESEPLPLQSPQSPPQGTPSMPPPAADARIALPTVAFDPPAAGCFLDGRWRVCVFGALAGGQGIRSWFNPAAPRAQPSGAPISPAVLLLTRGGAGLGFYPHVGDAERAAGLIALSAWQVAPGTRRTEWIALRVVEPGGEIGETAGNVYTPAAEGFDAADLWPAGRYVVRLQAANGTHWERFFALEIVTVVANQPCPLKPLVPEKRCKLPYE